MILANCSSYVFETRSKRVFTATIYSLFWCLSICGFCFRGMESGLRISKLRVYVFGGLSFSCAFNSESNKFCRISSILVPSLALNEVQKRQVVEPADADHSMCFEFLQFFCSNDWFLRFQKLTLFLEISATFKGHFKYFKFETNLFLTFS